MLGKADPRGQHTKPAGRVRGGVHRLSPSARSSKFYEQQAEGAGMLTYTSAHRHTHAHAHARAPSTASYTGTVATLVLFRRSQATTTLSRPPLSRSQPSEDSARLVTAEKWACRQRQGLSHQHTGALLCSC